MVLIYRGKWSNGRPEGEEVLRDVWQEELRERRGDTRDVHRDVLCD